MKLPRDVTRERLVRALRTLDYEITRQRGSHARLTIQRDGEQPETIPLHGTLKPGLLSGILKSVARYHQLTVEDVLRLLDF